MQNVLLSFTKSLAALTCSVIIQWIYAKQLYQMKYEILRNDFQMKDDLKYKKMVFQSSLCLPMVTWAQAYFHDWGGGVNSHVTIHSYQIFGEGYSLWSKLLRRVGIRFLWFNTCLQSKCYSICTGCYTFVFKQLCWRLSHWNFVDCWLFRCLGLQRFLWSLYDTKFCSVLIH